MAKAIVLFGNWTWRGIWHDLWEPKKSKEQQILLVAPIFIIQVWEQKELRAIPARLAECKLPREDMDKSFRYCS